MTTLAVLVVLELLLLAYIVTRILRAQVAPNPTLRAAILTSIALFAGMLSVTEPVEVILRGPGGMTVGAPTMLKHLAILGCAAGVLLMAMAQRALYRPKSELAVWASFLATAVPMVILHVIAGGGGLLTSVDYVEWSHSQPLLLAGMLIAYLGGLVACFGFFVVIWPLRLGTASGRGLAVMAVGAVFLAGWCVFRLNYLWEAATATTPPTDSQFLVTQVLSVMGMLLLTVGLLWSTAEADLAALNYWMRFRVLSERVLEVLPEVRRTSDWRLGLDTWVLDRAVEVLDGLHQIDRVTVGPTGFPQPPECVSDVEIPAVVAKLGRIYQGKVRV